MSSEAAYFPDALANTSEVREALGRPLETPALLAGEVSERPHSAAISISETSDESLLEQVRDGAKDALALLFRRYARAVRNVAYRILRNEAEADDLVQEVFLFIFRKAALFDSTQSTAASWIIHVAYHRAFDRRRYLNTRHFYSTQELDDTSCTWPTKGRKSRSTRSQWRVSLGKQLMARFDARLTPEQRGDHPALLL